MFLVSVDHTRVAAAYRKSLVWSGFPKPSPGVLGDRDVPSLSSRFCPPGLGGTVCILSAPEEISEAPSRLSQSGLSPHLPWRPS